MGVTTDRLSDATIEQARRVSVHSLAERYSQLHKVSTLEWAGPCPRCAGTDRFHVKDDWFFCRQCNPKGGDAIAFVRWMQPGLSFVDAVIQLTGGTLSTATHRKPARTRAAAQTKVSDEWQRRAAAMLHEAQERLLEPEGEPGQEYLASRGLDIRVWSQFGLGYRTNAAIPGTGAKQMAPAICLPWFVGGKLAAVRYRFLVAQNGNKQSAEYGSQFAGRLFGGQALPDWVTFTQDNSVRFESMCDLIICEGEINDMSIWQVAGNTNLHSLSMGSESAKFTDKMVAFAKRYRNVLIWMDKSEIARELQMAIPLSSSFVSPGGKDANDLLREGMLGAVLSLARLRACRDDDQREGLLWDLWDASQTWTGVDAGTAQVIQKIASDLGKTLAPIQQGI